MQFNNIMKTLIYSFILLIGLNLYSNDLEKVLSLNNIKSNLNFAETFDISNFNGDRKKFKVIPVRLLLEKYGKNSNEYFIFSDYDTLRTNSLPKKNEFAYIVVKDDILKLGDTITLDDDDLDNLDLNLDLNQRMSSIVNTKLKIEIDADVLNDLEKEYTFFQLNNKKIENILLDIKGIGFNKRSDK